MLVEESGYDRGMLKKRHKVRRCELCCAGEVWRGRRMGLNDNRIENLRIVCPSCAAAGYALLITEDGCETLTDFPYDL